MLVSFSREQNCKVKRNTDCMKIQREESPKSIAVPPTAHTGNDMRSNRVSGYFYDSIFDRRRKRSFSKLKKCVKTFYIPIAKVNVYILQKLDFLIDPQFSCKLG